MSTKAKLAILLTALLGSTACDTDSPTAPNTQAPPPPVVATDVKLRVAHLSPDAPAADVLVDGEVALAGVQYGTVSDYLDLSAGETQIQVTPAGQNDVAVIDTTSPLASGSVYTVAAMGFLAGLQPLVLLDDLGTTSGARLRPVHASPDAPAVDIAVQGGDVLVSGLTFRSAGPYIEVSAGTYDLEVRLAGTQTVVLSINGLQLSGGTTSTAFVIGSTAGGTLDAVVAQDAP